ncbi:MAG TPA: hypothetical protein VFQ43_10630, partial [Nitrososphaera sp.]|nr:hypothetical protein [Nitrososphaera sp.]
YFVLLLLSFNSLALAQTSQDRSSKLIQPGTSPEDYPLENLSTLNLYNGNLTTTVPIASVGGRGEAKFDLLLSVGRQWGIDNEMEDCPGTPSEECPPWGKIYSYPYFVGIPNLLATSPSVLIGAPHTPGNGNSYQSASAESTLLLRKGVTWYKDGPGRVLLDGDECSTATYGTLGIMFVGQDGTNYRLRDKLTNGRPGGSAPTGNLGREFVSGDGTSLTFVADADVIFPTGADCSPGSGNPSLNRTGLSGYLIFENGVRYRVESSYIVRISDRTGNRIQFSYDPPVFGAVSHLRKVVDSLNREIDISYAVQEPAPYGMSDVITVKGFGGAIRTIHISYKQLSDNLRSDFSAASIDQQFSDLDPEILQPNTGYRTRSSPFNPGLPGTAMMASALWLPDGRAYSFKYDNYGELARLELPTGGAYEYDWGAADGSAASGLHKGVTGHNADDAYGYAWVYRRVKQQRVYPDGISLIGYTTYSVAKYNNGDSDPTVVTTDSWGSLNSRLASEKHYFHGNAEHTKILESWPGTQYYVDWKEGREYRTEQISSDGTTILRRKSDTWSQTDPAWTQSFPACNVPENNPHVADSTTTLMDTNQVSKRTFLYDQFNNETDRFEYDYGIGTSGPLLRHSHTDFANSVNLVNGLDYSTTEIHLINLPTKQWVSSYVAGNLKKAMTTYEYDNYTPDPANNSHAALLTRNLISGLCDNTPQNCPGGPNFTDQNYKIRGNITGVTNFLLDAGGNSTASINSYMQYDVAGNTVRTVDARGNATNFDFADRFGGPDGDARLNPQVTNLNGQISYAFPTLITNALSQINYSQYDYYSGKPVDVEDENGVVTSYYYNGPLDRRTQIKRGVGTTAESQITFTYDDVSRVITSTSDLASNNDKALQVKTIYDGVGRVTETRQYEGGSNYAAIQRQYDAHGRAYRLSNPFRPWKGESAIWTQSTFDALDRVTDVTTPDGAVVHSTYVGNSITVIDQALRKRRSVTDALGRLLRVDEPDKDTGALDNTSGVPIQSTVYSYDILGDLVEVAQGTQPHRLFVYDSLKRLLSATNPESGTITYD